MIYTNPKANLYVLLREVRVLKEEQIVRFFRNDADPVSIGYLLSLMTVQRFIDYSRETNTAQLAGTQELTPDTVSSRVYTFWPIADIGAENVRSIVLAEYPFVFSVITNEDAVLDFAYIPNISIARLAGKQYDRSVEEGTADMTKRIAVVLDDATGREMNRFGFTGYCTLDEEKHAKYMLFT